MYYYIRIYRYVLFALVCACSYLHMFTYSLGFNRGLITLHLYFEVPYILVYLYIQRSSCTNIMIIYKKKKKKTKASLK